MFCNNENRMESLTEYDKRKSNTTYSNTGYSFITFNIVKMYNKLGPSFISYITKVSLEILRAEKATELSINPTSTKTLTEGGLQRLVHCQISVEV